MPRFIRKQDAQHKLVSDIVDLRREIQEIRRARKQRRRYESNEDDNEPEHDPNERMPGESYNAWWERIGCKLHESKPWTWF